MSQTDSNSRPQGKISFHCQCGAKVVVSQKYAGRLGKCPQCGKANRIPGGKKPAQPKPQATQPAASQAQAGAANDSELDALANAAASPSPSASHAPLPRTSHQGGQPRRSLVRQPNAIVNLRSILLASAVLLTFLLPWMAEPDYDYSGFGDRTRVGYEVIMSWDLIDAIPGTFGAWVIISWIAAAGIIVASCLTRDLVLGIVKGGCGLLCLILFLTIGSDFEDNVFSLDDTPLGSRFVINLLGAIFLAACVVASHLRRRLGTSLGTRIAQSVSSGGVCLMIAIGLIIALTDFSKIPPPFRGEFFKYMIVPLLMQLTILAGAILCLVAGAKNGNNRQMTGVGLGLIYGGFGGMITYIIFLPVIMEAWAASFSLLLLNVFILLILGIAYPLLSGITGIIVGAIQYATGQEAPGPTSRPRVQATLFPTASSQAQPGPAAQAQAAAVGAGNARRRLSDLKEMYDEGLITQEEFAVRRARILEST